MDKRCPKCGETKPIEAFGVSRREGTQAWCKACMNAAARARRATAGGAEKIKAYRKSDQAKQLRAQREQTAKRREWRKAYYQKRSEQNAEYRKRSDVKAKSARRNAEWRARGGTETLKEWRRSPEGKASGARCKAKRRAALTAPESTLTAQEWQAICERAKGRCYYCRKVKPLTMDHVIPLSKGGSHTAANIVPACQSCNSSKGAKRLLLL